MILKLLSTARFLYCIGIVVFSAICNALSVQFKNVVKLHNIIINGRVLILPNKQSVIDILQNLYQTAITLIVIYFIAWRVKKYVDRKLVHYQSKLTNLKPIKKSYTSLLSHLQFTVLNNIWNVSSFLGLFVAALQYFILGRVVNFLVSLLNLLLNFIITELAIRDDMIILKESEKLCKQLFSYDCDKNNIQNAIQNIKENKNCDFYFKPISELKSGEIIELKLYEVVPVAKAQLVYASNDESAIFNVESNNGEAKTYQRFFLNDYLVSDLISLNANPVLVRIVETHNFKCQSNNNQDNFTTSLVQNQTKISILMCLLLFILIQVGKITNTEFLSIFDLISDGISTIIAFNYLIPTMKIVPVTIIRGLTTWIFAKRKFISSISSDIIKNWQSIPSQQYIDTQLQQPFNSKRIILVCDKTGTLTKNDLSIKDYIIEFSKHEKQNPYSEDCVPILCAINSTFVLDNVHYANSPEERIIGKFLSTNFPNLGFSFPKLDVQYNTWTDIVTKNFDFTTTKMQIYTIPFVAGMGRIAWLKMEKKSYIVVQYQSEQLANIVDFKSVCWSPLSSDRSLMIAAIKVDHDFTRNQFEEWCNNYKNALHNKIVIKGLQRMAEFYFDDPLREFTADGFNLLNSKNNISTLLCTGDSMPTALYIGEKIGMRKNTPCIDGTVLLKDNQDNKMLNSIDFGKCKNVIFGKFTASQKGQLIKYLQYKYPNDLIMMFGDQKNDQLAIMNAQYGFVQSDGCLDCKIVGQAQVLNLLGVYNYLFQVRRLRLFGQFWLMNQFHVFNCILAAICLMGLHFMAFPQKAFLFLDPWNPVRSLIMTNFMAITLIVASYKIGEYCTADQVGYNNMMSLKKLFAKSLVVFVISLLVSYISRFFISIDSHLLIVVILSLIDSSSLFLNGLLCK